MLFSPHNIRGLSAAALRGQKWADVKN